MSDWLKRITSIISPLDEASDDALALSTTPSPSLFKLQSQLADNYKERAPELKMEDIPVKAKDVQNEDKEDNLEVLKRLRQQPRGTQVDSRIAAIRELLGEKEIFKTLKMLRWPQGVRCPRCNSSNVVRRDPPADAVDQRHHYECLNCKGDGSLSDFDDFTGLPVGSLYSLRQWILCWYLIGFCSVAQISKALGISLNEVLQLAAIGNELTEIENAAKLKSERTAKEKKAKSEKENLGQEHNEELTRSASKSPLKPGYKSKK